MTEYDRQFFFVVPLSLGLLAIGLVQILIPRVALSWRVALSGAILAASLAGASGIAESETASGLAMATVPASLALAVLVRGRSANRTARGPVLAGVGIAAAGAALLALSVVRYETGLADKIDNDTADIELLGFVPEREPEVERQAVTDRGRALPLWRAKAPMTRTEMDALENRCFGLLAVPPGVDRSGAADDATNCHGWVFTGGRAIVVNTDVEAILADNGYEPTDRPRPGDLAIYRNHGLVSHTAIVREVEPGTPVVVESKWSWMGVFRHAVDGSIYGSDFTFYRTARPEHVVKMTDRTPVQLGGAE